jgi:hypothetical protein
MLTTTGHSLFWRVRPHGPWFETGVRYQMYHALALLFLVLSGVRALGAVGLPKMVVIPSSRRRRTVAPRTVGIGALMLGTGGYLPRERCIRS